MKAMLEGSENVFRDWIGIMLIAIGWNADISAWFGGVIMAMGGASVARSWHPERDVAELWVVIGGAFFVANIGGMLSLHFAPGAPVQLVMAGCGFFSRFGIRLALKMAGRVERKSDAIADRAIERVLPGAGEDDK